MIEEILTLWNSGKKEKAIEESAKWLQANPTDIGMYLQLGNFLMLSKQPVEAVEILKAAQFIEPENAEIQYALANALYHLEDFDAALKLFSSIKVDYLKNDIFWMQAQCFSKLNQSEKALAFMLTFQANDDEEYAQKDAFLAEQFMSLKQFQSAYDYFSKALEKQSEALWWFERGVCGEVLNSDTAQADFAMAQQLDYSLYQEKMQQLQEIEQFIKKQEGE